MTERELIRSYYRIYIGNRLHDEASSFYAACEKVVKVYKFRYDQEGITEKNVYKIRKVNVYKKRAVKVDPVPVGFFNIYSDSISHRHDTEESARSTNTLSAIEVAVPLYRKAKS